MVLYFANPSSQKVRDAMRKELLGYIDTPAQGNKREPGVAWVADNGCFRQRVPRDIQYIAWLLANRDDAGTCLFATAPDVVGDAKETLKRSKPFLPVIRALGYPVALVAQDGLENLTVPWDSFDALFIGGSTEWKLGKHAPELGDGSETSRQTRPYGTREFQNPLQVRGSHRVRLGGRNVSRVRTGREPAETSFVGGQHSEPNRYRRKGYCMTAPDPGLTDLIAAHQVMSQQWVPAGAEYRLVCKCGIWMGADAFPAHVALVVKQYINGRTAPVLEDFDWHIQNASNGAVCAAEADDGQALMSYQLEMGIYKRAAQLLRAALEGEQQ